jgi:hypothetical protein
MQARRPKIVRTSTRLGTRSSQLVLTSRAREEQPLFMQAASRMHRNEDRQHVDLDCCRPAHSIFATDLNHAFAWRRLSSCVGNHAKRPRRQTIVALGSCMSHCSTFAVADHRECRDWRCVSQSKLITLRRGELDLVTPPSPTRTYLQRLKAVVDSPTFARRWRQPR